MKVEYRSYNQKILMSYIVRVHNGILKLPKRNKLVPNSWPLNIHIGKH